jgi:MFS transporter, DHA1 family, tetracycline resistance protein
MSSLGHQQADGQTFPPFPRRLLFVASFLLASGGGMVFSLLGRLQDEFGFATSGLGLLTAASFVAAPIASIFLAPFGDRGHSRRLLILGLALGTFGALGFSFATNLWQFVISRAFIGAAFGVFGPAARGILLRRAKSTGAGFGQELARLAGVDTAGFTLSPALGAILLHFAGLRAPFFLVAVAIPVIGGVLLNQLPRDTTPVEDHPEERLAFDLLRLPTVRVALLFAVGNFLPIGVYDSLWARYLQDLGATTLFVGLSLTLYGIPYVLVSGPAGRLVDRWGPIRSISIATLFVIPLIIVYGFAGNYWAVAILALVEASIGAVAQPAAQAAMARACPPHRLSAGQGLAGACASLTAAATALVAAPTYARFGSEGVFTSAAFAVAIIIGGALLLNRRVSVSENDRVAPSKNHSQ